jgi:hypothetical protein
MERHRRDAGMCIHNDKLDDTSCKANDACRKEVSMAGAIARVIQVS